jgi:hypothetical protein
MISLILNRQDGIKYFVLVLVGSRHASRRSCAASRDTHGRDSEDGHTNITFHAIVIRIIKGTQGSNTDWSYQLQSA